MSSSLAIDGLVSGLDTTSIINAQMAVEALPQTQLKTKATDTQKLLTALQSLNAAASSLADLAATAAKPTSMNLFTASSSTTSVTATAGSSALAGSISFTVDSVAAAQVTVSAARTQWPDSPPVVTIQDANGVRTEITAASTSMTDVASAINAKKLGITAVAVAAGTDASGTKLYRLQFSANQTGTAAGFTVFRGSASDVAGGTAVDLSQETGAATVTAAADAKVTLWAGSSAAQTISSSTNVFTDVLPGVTVSVTRAETTPVTLTVARDDAAVTKVASGLVDSVNALLNGIKTASAVSSSTSATGAVTSTAGVFTGNSTVRSVQDAIFSAASAPVGDRSPSSIGLVVGKDGTITFDADKYAAALAADEKGTEAMVQTIAGRIATAATNASDKYTGTLSGTITGQQSDIKRLNDQIADWDVRLASRKTSLQSIYSQLEVQLSTLKSQSDYLTSQLASLSTSSSSDK